MEKEIIVEDKKNKAYKLILKANINEDDENLLKKGPSLLALSHKFKQPTNPNTRKGIRILLVQEL